jgi:hypothetical protein
MSFLDMPINAADLPVSENSFDPLPAGWYQVNIKGAELKDTKAGTGQYIAVQYDVLGPTHQGRVVFGNLNIRNPNPKAEEIGRQQLGELMRAIGLATVQDTDQLIGGQLSIKLSVRKSEEYGDSNDVKGYKALEGAITQAPAQASPQVATASAAPWAK